MNPQREEKLVALVKEELYQNGTTWFTELASAMGVLEPYTTNFVSMDTPELIDRAVIRVVLMLISYEEMLSEEQGTMLKLAEKLYPIVKEKAECMKAAAAMYRCEEVSE